MIRMVVLGQLLLLGTAANGAQAAEQVMTGWYLGASAGAARHDVGNGSAPGTIVIAFPDIIVNVPRTFLETDSDSSGWRGLAGYRFNRYIAAELEYLDFGTSQIDETYRADLPTLPSPILIERHFTTDVSGPAVSGLGKLPIGGRCELFLRVGVLFVESRVYAERRPSITHSDRVLIGGAGVDWNFTGRWSARLEYQRSQDIERNFDIGESHVELLSLGVLRAF